MVYVYIGKQNPAHAHDSSTVPANESKATPKPEKGNHQFSEVAQKKVIDRLQSQQTKVNIGGVTVKAKATSLNISGSNQNKGQGFQIRLNREGKSYQIESALWQGKDKEDTPKTTPMSNKEAAHHLKSIDKAMVYGVHEKEQAKKRLQSMLKERRTSPALEGKKAFVKQRLQKAIEKPAQQRSLSLTR